MPFELPVVEIAGRFALAVLLISILLALARLVKGPAAADRIVALDLISILIVAFLAAYSIYAGETSFLDVAIGYALIAFLGTVSLARFLMRSALKKSENREQLENMRRHE
ncbi:MAG: cation:proton antiporter [Desulfobacteraceae bacterium]|jgi:multicomponent Na+:H+ antiporter subunit F|nr:cation:proton antiporter [Desulfobacteraceae bacterium]